MRDSETMHVQGTKKLLAKNTTSILDTAAGRIFVQFEGKQVVKQLIVLPSKFNLVFF